MPLVAIDARISGTSTGRYIDKLIEHLAKMDTGIDFNIITSPERVEFMKKIAPDFYVIKSNVNHLGFGEQKGLLKEINGIDADLVHFAMVNQPLLYRGNVVTTVHDLIMTKTKFKNPKTNIVKFKIKQIVYKFIIKVACNKSTTIITATEYIKREVMAFTHQPEKKFKVTQESADKIKDKAEPISKLSGKSFLFYVGRPWPHKNLERLIEAYAILKVKFPDLCLVLGGKKDWNYDQTEAAVKAQDIKDITFTGFITDGQLRWLYENCSAYIFPSLSEGFGLPGLEAMVHGAAVVSSNATTLPEVYGDAAEYFDPLDIDDMADAIAKVLGSEKLREELIAKGRRQAAKYSWKRMAEQTLAVYEKALKG